MEALLISRSLALAASLCLAGSACRKQQEDLSGLLLEVKEGLAERDAKLQSYTVRGTVTELGQVARYEFAYRAPNRMLGELLLPSARTLAFDGEHLFDVLPGSKRFTTVQLKRRSNAPSEKLMELFTPFMPDGFRAPMLNLKELKATFGTHPRAPKTVVLTQHLHEGAEVAYEMRYPSLDFLSRSMVSGSHHREVRVEEEQCDKKLALCYPVRIAQMEDGQPGAVTVLEDLRINPPVPVETFTLTAPEGYAQATSELAL
ncbi:MAG: hypothetical protein ACT4TC_03000 [Myxococcaceae bacterium]